jgi:dTDP-4-amino-4,6-dideoxygalactose transaminase
MQESIPLARPEITEEDIAAVTAVLRTPFLSNGPQVNAFEDAVAKYVGTRHAVAVNSGTSALHLVLRSFGLKGGDEVIVPSFAFAAVGNVLLQENLVPIFTDIESETFNLDPGSVVRAIGPRTKAILFVHTFGIPARVNELRALSKERGLHLIEDASEALGSSVQGRRVGGFGDVAIFAFYPNKMVTTGEGGVVVTSDDQIAERCRRLRNQGRVISNQWYQQMEPGFSYRLSDINCALGLSQLARIDVTLSRRRAVARLYSERLSHVPELQLVSEKAGEEIGWFTYPVTLAERFSQEERDRLWAEMNAAGVGCARYFAPLHRQPVMRGQTTDQNLPVTNSVAGRVFQLPFFTQLTEEQIDAVGNRLEAALARIARPAV